MWGEEGVGGGGVLLEVNDTDLVRMERIVGGSDRVGLSEVRFMAEVVTNQGVGLSLVRDGEGRVIW